MKREDKNKIIEDLTQKITDFNHFYIADISELDAVATSDLRRKCFEQEVNLIVCKNTLLKSALDKAEGSFENISDVLKDSTSIMFCNTGNIPARLIKEFRKSHERPILKAAYVEESVYYGHEELETLVNLKSKNELIADVIALLQSPAKNVISALQSGGGKLSGILKTLGDKES